MRSECRYFTLFLRLIDPKCLQQKWNKMKRETRELVDKTPPLGPSHLRCTSTFDPEQPQSGAAGMEVQPGEPGDGQQRKRQTALQDNQRLKKHSDLDLLHKCLIDCKLFWTYLPSTMFCLEMNQVLRTQISSGEVFTRHVLGSSHT